MIPEAKLVPFPSKPNSNHPISALWKQHGELIAALSGGGLTLIAFLLELANHPRAWLLYPAAYLIGGYFKTKQGISDTIRTRELNVELLMITAAIGAACINHWLEGAVLIFIFALSGALETYSTAKSTHALSALMNLQPEVARLVASGRETMISVKQITPGDIILVKPGERIPADAVITDGETTVNEATMTGESVPVFKKSGAELMAGTMNLDGSVFARVTKRCNDSLFSKILDLVQSAQKEKAPTQLFIERFERIYVKVVLIVTALMLFAPHVLLGWSWSETIYRAMVLLVVASPCALVASTTPAVLSAVASGARHGILIKGGIHLEQLAMIKLIAFDKTGTITNGAPEVTDFINNSTLTDSILLRRIAAIENQSSHPLGKALVAYTQKICGHVPLPKVGKIKVKPGFGIIGCAENTEYMIGKEAMMDAAALKEFLQKNNLPRSTNGETLVYAASEGKIIGRFSLKDRVRDSAAEAIRSLNKYGIKTVMITGDNQQTAAAVQRESGISGYIANCLPENKAIEIKRLNKKYGHVAMCGDGINDTPALVQASVGIAMGAGNDAALETADIVLMKNDLTKIAEAVRLSKKMSRIVKMNIIFAMAMIVFLIATNFLQFLTMPFGVVGHEGSTILVILNGLRLLRG
ncbi:heavy metal translocating P-type ATPase [Sporolactobacillus shoreicorticis]|uniref:Heavy metal translocating P-type ATPase n=1 Tax=Sporolactobacillus shoreicorticis TaxID=1923877 RepID=A0ABW5S2X3_9BACL|nr:heavy metal translocating P-type ATPase [Sporolactobacillus shoreicorticis]MCO7125806.1 heavy metal translocating P-type ATPase [Sporolactobacillus shoreicorticis]